MQLDLILKKQSGCVLAHSMGLGKTLQTIVLLHTLHYCGHALSLAPSRTYLLLAPASVMHNWKAEFDLWLDKNTAIPKELRQIPVYLFGDTEEGRGKTETKNGDPQKPTSSIESKRNLLAQWSKTGGVFIVSFESYRMLLSNKPV
jgi:transcriptional regulator ATRX